MNRQRSVRSCLVAVLLVLVSTAASAQWVMVGRKVVGKITSLTQPKDAKSPGYDVATVVLDADASKVYSTAVDLLSKNPKMTITSRDDAKRRVAFTMGDLSAELQITELGDHLSQLLIASGAAPGQVSGTSTVLDATKRICDRLGVKYTVD